MIRIIPNTLEEKSPRKGGYKSNIVSVLIDDNGIKKEIAYYEDKDFGFGSEVYQGPNYVEPFNSKARSVSRNYKQFKGMPRKYGPVVSWLQVRHIEIFGR